MVETPGLYGSELIGPFVRVEQYKVVYRDFLVPNLIVHRNDDDTWCLVLDGRFITENVSKLELHRWIAFIADAQAIGAGYPCHGAEHKYNPYRVGCVGLGSSLPPQEKTHLTLVSTEPEGHASEDR